MLEMPRLAHGRLNKGGRIRCGLVTPARAPVPKSMKLSELKKAGHWPTLLAAFLYFDVSFMIWTLLGPLGAQIGESLGLTPQQKGLMVAVPILAGAFLRI